MEILFEVEIKGRDKITIYKNSEGKSILRAQGCSLLKSHLLSLQNEFGSDIKKWVLKSPESHEQFLVKKLQNQILGIPTSYPHTEICHCRLVPTQVVEDAIFNGAKSIEAIRRQTSASSACGSCSLDVEGLLKFWAAE